MKARVIGIGGVFFKARDRAALCEWYRKHLGFDVQSWCGVQFFFNRPDRPEPPGYTVWSPFSQETRYFEPSAKPYMLNLRVADLDALLPALRGEGVQVLARYEESEQGKFGYALDPEGTLLELWEPATNDPSLA